MRTHYDVLGVAPSSPDLVIKAAYRALAKEYHPDGTNASPESTDRFIEIQAAYAVLSKPHARSEYDAELEEVLGYAFTAGAAPSGAPLPTAPWRPPDAPQMEIERLCARLALYSEALAQSFHAAYLRGECGDDPAFFASKMERNFFHEFFGDDSDTQALARLLLLGGRTGAAFTLNQLVAEGSDLDGKNPKAVLPALLEQHFQDDALFAEWLKVKFGLTPLYFPTARDGEVLEAATMAETAGSPPPAPSRQASSPKVVRSLALIFIWAVALYLALFAALPAVQ